LRPYSEVAPKCLMELEPGISIIDFIVERLRSNGISEIFIVTRPEYVEVIRSRVGDSIEVIEADLEFFGNLYSMWLAARRIGGKFLAVMSDHIFERDLLRAVLERVVSAEEAFVLCLDMEPAVVEAEEGLKLRLDRDRVSAADKTLEPVYGTDTGVIFCNDSALEYIQRALEKKGPGGLDKGCIELGRGR